MVLCDRGKKKDMGRRLVEGQIATNAEMFQDCSKRCGSFKVTGPRERLMVNLVRGPGGQLNSISLELI